MGIFARPSGGSTQLVSSDERRPPRPAEDVVGDRAVDDDDPGAQPYPYSLPSPPKAWLFGGLGYGYGVGCGAGPVFGLGVGLSPGGVQFGAGVSPVGVFCGVGLAAGLVAGQGSAYVPYGLSSSFFLAPRFVMLEGMADLYRARRAKRRERSKPRRGRAMDSMWPPALRNWILGLRNRIAPPASPVAADSIATARPRHRSPVELRRWRTARV
jgi:hypothetical protein